MRLLATLAICLVSCAPSEPKQESYVVTDRHYDFIVLGDNRPDVVLFETFLSTISTFDVDKMVHVGDMVEFSSPVGFLAFQDALDNYLRSSIRFIPVVGNHDMDGSGGNTEASMQLFNAVFDLPESYKGYQKIDFPSYIFIVLNSYYHDEEKEIGPTQFAWLETTLETIHSETPTKPIFLFDHHPIYPAGYHPPITNADAVNALLQKYSNVVAFFSGHEHVYYHEEVASGDHKIQYYVTGGAGSQLHHVSKGVAVHHMLGVTVSPSFNVEVLDEKGNVLDL